MNFHIPLPEIFEVRVVFLVLVLSHSRRDLSEGKKKGKKHSESSQKEKNIVFLHFNNALVVFYYYY